MQQVKRTKTVATIRDKSIRDDVIRNLIDTRKYIIGGNEKDAIIFLDRVLGELDPCWRIGRT
jgi:hypothetical protein